MAKPYTLEEIKRILVNELKKTKAIMTWGSIGSLNVQHDIDTIITKKPGEKTSDFFREIHKVYDNLERCLSKKYRAKVISFPGGRGELSYLSDIKDVDLSFDTMSYTSYPKIKRDWEWALGPNESLKDLLKNQNFLLGSFSDLLRKDFQKANYYDYVSVRLYHIDRIKSHYPLKILLEVMNKNFDFMFRKRLGLKTPIAKNEKDVREIFYKLCDKLDDLEEKKQRSEE